MILRLDNLVQKCFLYSLGMSLFLAGCAMRSQVLVPVKSAKQKVQITAQLTGTREGKPPLKWFTYDVTLCNNGPDLWLVVRSSYSAEGRRLSFLSGVDGKQSVASSFAVRSSTKTLPVDAEFLYGHLRISDPKKSGYATLVLVPLPSGQDLRIRDLEVRSRGDSHEVFLLTCNDVLINGEASLMTLVSPTFNADQYPRHVQGDFTDNLDDMILESKYNYRGPEVTSLVFVESSIYQLPRKEVIGVSP